MKNIILVLVLILATGTATASPFFQRELPPGPDTTFEWQINDMTAADIDGDGKAELVIAWRDAATTTRHVVMTYNWFAGALREIARFDLATIAGAAWVYLEDTDTDGLPELVTAEGAGDAGGALTIHEWSGTGWSSVWSTTIYSFRRGNLLDAGDTDGDGFNELVVAVDWYGRYLGVVEYDPLAATYSMGQTIGSNDFRSAEVADVNGDGLSDIVVGTANWSWFDGRVYSWTGAGYGLLWDSGGLGDVTAACFDHDGNGMADIVLANRASPHVTGQNGLHVYAWDGGTFQFQYLLSPDVPLISPKGLDFDNDGTEDLVAIAVEQDHNDAYFGDGLHFYRRDGDHLVDYSVIDGLIGTAAATVDGCDLDNDGYNEMIMGNGNTSYGPTGYWIQHVMEFPIIAGIGDIPLDDGRQVRVTWSRAGSDNSTDAVYTQLYRVWRKVRDGMKAVGAELMTSAAGEVFELVGESPAMNWDMYALVVPTLADEGEVTDPLFDFIVTAHLSDNRSYHSSPVQQGYSIDQTAPAAPEALVGEFTPYSVTLGWDSARAADFSHYNVYKVIDGAETLIGTTTLPTYQDANIGHGYTTCAYRVSASDWAGNESDKAEISASAISGVPDGSGVPRLAADVSAYPNPFNPRTTIRFTVPEVSTVRIVVYDVAGRRIRELTNTTHSAGNHEVEWDGRNDLGRSASAGAYIVRMTAGRHEASYRVALVK